jgi:hypothetical protein
MGNTTLFCESRVVGTTSARAVALGSPPQRCLRRDRGSRSARLPLELWRGLSLWRSRRHGAACAFVRRPHGARQACAARRSVGLPNSTPKIAAALASRRHRSGLLGCRRGAERRLARAIKSYPYLGEGDYELFGSFDLLRDCAVGLQGCSSEPGLVSGNKRGGIISNANVSDQAAVRNLADNHCRQYGKVAQITVVDVIGSRVKFLCIEH